MCGCYPTAAERGRKRERERVCVYKECKISCSKAVGVGPTSLQ